MVKRVAIITPGGDCSGMNACIRAIVRDAIYYKFDVFGIYRGYQGLIEGDIKQLGARSVSGIIHYGGTVLKSTRCEAIRTARGLTRAVSQLKKNRIDYLIVIGGDGSLQAGFKFSKMGISVIGIPASIDNDIYGTEETIGFDTAIDVAVEAVDKIRDTATSFNRVFLVEVMGGEHGFLALAVGLASGAEYILIPEIKYNLSKICAELKMAKERGKTSEIIIFAEGAGDVFEVARKIERKTDIPARASSLGYIQRGGAPSARSRTIGSLFGSYAVRLIRKGLKNKLVVLKNNKVSHIPLAIAAARSKRIDKGFYTLARRLAI